MNELERINFYLGNLYNYNNIDTLFYSKISFFYKINNIHHLKEIINSINFKSGSLNTIKLCYLIPIYNTFSEYKLNCKKCYIVAGDIFFTISPFSFCKNRTIESDNGVILRCFNFQRHWEKYYNKPKDISFEQKISKVIWRGTTTGNENKPGNRFTLIKKWFGKNKNIDIGFSSVCQGKNAYSKYIKNQLQISDMHKFKYILSVEGNDKDSGLNWKLNSNSVVFMTRPRYNSWLMETMLVPDYHYVLLSDDFSDLEEKYIWCEENQEKCKEIIKNANDFMRQFADVKKEKEIEKAVIEKYFELTTGLF
jgi:hypothetical protein